MPRKKINKIVSSTSNNSTKIIIDNITEEEIKPIENKKEEEEVDTINENIIELSDLKGKEILHYKMLDKFFSTCDSTQIQRMVDVINGNHLVSLRFLDWFVTRYCYLYKTCINVNNSFSIQNNFNINISYKAQLKSFTKKYFDPFKRKKKFYVSYDNQKINFLTTLGQLNFFRWAITNDIITYTETNYRLIVSKYDYVNSFFKKYTSNSSNNSNQTLSSLNTKTDDDNTIENIYSSTNNNVIVDNNTKSTFKTPRITRNIYIEL